jgi:hypothetical protein
MGWECDLLKAWTIDAIHWIVEYECSVREKVGEPYRAACVAAWSKRKVASEAMVGEWITIAKRLQSLN